MLAEIKDRVTVTVGTLSAKSEQVTAIYYVRSRRQH